MLISSSLLKLNGLRRSLPQFVLMHATCKHYLCLLHLLLLLSSSSCFFSSIPPTSSSPLWLPCFLARAFISLQNTHMQPQPPPLSLSLSYILPSCSLSSSSTALWCEVTAGEPYDLTAKCLCVCHGGGPLCQWVSVAEGGRMPWQWLLTSTSRLYPGAYCWRKIYSWPRCWRDLSCRRASVCTSGCVLGNRGGWSGLTV